MPYLLEFIRDRLPWPLVIAGGAGLLAVLVGSREVGNWGGWSWLASFKSECLVE